MASANLTLTLPVTATMRATLHAAANQLDDTAGDTATLCRWLARHGLDEAAGPEQVVRAVARTLREAAEEAGPLQETIERRGA